MSWWMDWALSARLAVLSLVAAPGPRGSLGRMRRELITWRTALRDSAREQKVGLLGLVLILVVIAWP